MHRFLLSAAPERWLTPFQRYRRDGHTQVILRDLPLTPESIVLDIGGYLGDYTAAILERYACRVHVFEPVPAFAEAIKTRFAPEPGVTVHAYGLGETDRTVTLHLSDDGTGAFAAGEPVEVAIRSVSSLATSLPGTIDLAAINIEGAEYDLVPLLAEAGMLQRIERLIIQFHYLGPESAAARDLCRHSLEQTHRMLWNYDFVWECWQREGHR